MAFSESLRAITQRDGALLIFDEVITGFRLAYGGAQNAFHIQPDLTVLGKIIGGGLPVAAYGGRRDIMEKIAPLGPVYQAGTLSGNPLAMRAGLATLPQIDAPGFYPRLKEKAERLAEGLRDALRESGVHGQVNVAGSLLTLFFRRATFTTTPAQKCRTRLASPPSFAKCSAAAFSFRPRNSKRFSSPPPTAPTDIDRTIAAARESLHAIRNL